MLPAAPAIQLWLTHLGAEAEADDFTALVDAERAQALQFSRADLRLRYLRVRAAVRRALAHFSGLPPHALRFERSTTGKPQLADLPISFNISHSGDYLAVAITHQNSLGVDLEQVAAKRSRDAIAHRYFHSSEVALLQALEPAPRERAFYRLWTLKEAFFKARGTGISTGLERAVFAFEGAAIQCQFAPELQENPDEWHFWQWQAGERFTLALACQSPPAPSLTVKLYCDPGCAGLLADLHLIGRS